MTDEATREQEIWQAGDLIKRFMRALGQDVETGANGAIMPEEGLREVVTRWWEKERLLEVLAAAQRAESGASDIVVREADGAPFSVLSSAAYLYESAIVVFTSGQNRGVRTSIQSISNSQSTASITLNDDIPNPLSVGDGIRIFRTPGGSVNLSALQAISDQAASTDFSSFTAPFSGTATILVSLATASTLSLKVTDKSGTSVTSDAYDGSTLTAGRWYDLSFQVSAGAKYALQVGTAQSGNMAVGITGALD